MDGKVFNDFLIRKQKLVVYVIKVDLYFVDVVELGIYHTKFKRSIYFYESVL